MTSIGSYARPALCLLRIEERLLAESELTLAAWRPFAGCASAILMCDTISHPIEKVLIHPKWALANLNWPKDYYWPQIFRDDFDGSPEWLHLVKIGVLNLLPVCQQCNTSMHLL